MERAPGHQEPYGQQIQRLGTIAFFSYILPTNSPDFHALVAIKKKKVKNNFFEDQIISNSHSLKQISAQEKHLNKMHKQYKL